MNRRLIVDIISASFIVLFIYAAFSKILEFEKFRVQVGQSQLLTAFTDIIVWLVPITELIISTFLTFASTRLLGLYASFSLMTMFSAYIYFVLQFSDDIPCSCGGILEDMSWNAHLIFNIGFVFLSLVGILLHCRAHFATQEPSN